MLNVRPIPQYKHLWSPKAFGVIHYTLQHYTHVTILHVEDLHCKRINKIQDHHIALTVIQGLSVKYVMMMDTISANQMEDAQAVLHSSAYLFQQESFW